MNQNLRANCWQLPRTKLEFFDGPLLMGIVNVTPDSFSDGGRWLDPRRAIDHGLRLVDDGAAILDIGGESTRPFSEPVPPQEQLRRVLPVLRELARQVPAVPLSIDTASAEVAAAAIEAGAQIINDVSGLTADPRMLEVAARTGAAVCVMHMRGTPQTMQIDPRYDDCVREIKEYLQDRHQALVAAGISPEKICLDPGIGFGKTHEHNWELIRRIAEFHELRAPLLVGHSRKGFIAKAVGQDEDLRDAGTLGISLYLAGCGVQILRLHEVRRTRAALQTFCLSGNGALCQNPSNAAH